MSLFREIPPTAGLPLYARDFVSALLTRKGQGSLEEDFKSYLASTYAEITYSGTAAFYIILEALKGLSAKKTVIIPAFICPLIPLAIKRAGLKVLACDINKDNFDFDINQLRIICSENKDILAILAVHLAGIPVDLDAIREAAGENKIFIIEDCAQSLGALYQGKKTGTLGDFSFFSLCRGKGLTIYEGGVLVSKDTFTAKIHSAISRLVKPDISSESIKILELAGYWFFYRPLLFWFVFRLPQIFWQAQGKLEKASIEYFSVDFPLHKVSRIRKKLGHAVFSKVDKEIVGQRQRAINYITALKNVPGVKIVTEPEGGISNYPYLTLILADPAKRNRALDIFRNLGLGVSQIYLYAITDYAYLKDITGNQNCPNARYIAERHITLTTSSFLKQKDAYSIIEIIKKV